MDRMSNGSRNKYLFPIFVVENSGTRGETPRSLAGGTPTLRARALPPRPQLSESGFRR
jgi:hypothetical protein